MNQTPAAQPSRPKINPSGPSNSAGPQPPRRGQWRTPIVVITVIVLLLAIVWWVNHRAAARGPGFGGPGGGRAAFARFGGGPNAPLPVTVYATKKGAVHVYLEALGTVTPAHVATIRTQISGQLQQVAFQEGQMVHEGDLLAVIDPRPYENSLAQAQAQFQQATAQLNTAELDLQRYETLAKQDSIAKQQVDSTRSQVNQDQGLVAAAQAAIATANLNIAYCHIKAPFDGRVGLRQVDPGNYVTAGDASGIVVLTQTKPITVIFTLPEDNMAPISARLRSGAKLPVDAYDRAQTKKIAGGTLESVDNQIDPTTGTFKLRALFTNEDETLFPNQFVNVQLLLNTIENATVVPTSAIERGQQGTFVYVVSSSQTAEPRNVTLGATEGEIVQVVSGLNVGEQVVTDGADKLKDGQKVILNGGQHTGGGHSWGQGNGQWGGPGQKKWGGGQGDGKWNGQHNGTWSGQGDGKQWGNHEKKSGDEQDGKKE